MIFSSLNITLIFELRVIPFYQQLYFIMQCGHASLGCPYHVAHAYIDHLPFLYADVLLLHASPLKLEILFVLHIFSYSSSHWIEYGKSLFNRLLADCPRLLVFARYPNIWAWTNCLLQVDPLYTDTKPSRQDASLKMVYDFRRWREEQVEGGDTSTGSKSQSGISGKLCGGKHQDQCSPYSTDMMAYKEVSLYSSGHTKLYINDTPVYTFVSV